MIIPEIKRILYATDLSKNASQAFYYALSLACQYGAVIDVVHVLEPASGVFGPHVKRIMETEEQESAIRDITDRWRRFCESLDGGTGYLKYIPTNIMTRVGQPVEEILSAAEEAHSDILVLGTHGKGFLQQTFLGSVSRGVLDRALTPVVIVPLPDDRNE